MVGAIVRNPWGLTGQESRAGDGSVVPWTISATAATALSADRSRYGLHMYNDSTSATVYITMGNGVPTLTAYGFPLPPLSYFDCPPWMTHMAVQAIGTVASGVVHFQIGTIV